jgi:protein involved in polysaccharide export with SLBB domain
LDRWHARASLVLSSMLATASCGPHTDNSLVQLPAPTESATVGAGDVFTMQIVGEKDLPVEYQIASDGYVNLPYIHRVHVEGLEPQEISDLVTKRLIEAKVRSDPSVIIRVREYSSKHVMMLGQISHVGRLAFVPGLTLMQAVSMSGGFTSIAKKDQVKLTRRNKNGSRTVILSVSAIEEGHSPDIPLQAGDQIYVGERIF